MNRTTDGWAETAEKRECLIHIYHDGLPNKYIYQHIVQSNVNILCSTLTIASPVGLLLAQYINNTSVFSLFAKKNISGKMKCKCRNKKPFYRKLYRFGNIKYELFALPKTSMGYLAMLCLY